MNQMMEAMVSVEKIKCMLGRMAIYHDKARIIARQESVFPQEGFFFDYEKLLLAYNGKKLQSLTGIEKTLCNKMFLEIPGHQFPTQELEDIVYFKEPPTRSRREKFERAVKRLDDKIRTQTKVKRFVKYTPKYVFLDF